MPSTYRVSPISPAQIDRAYLLVQPVAQSLDLPGWRTFCHGIVNRQHDPSQREHIIVATNPRDYIQGLCLMRLAEHPSYGRLLDVPIFVITSVADEPGVAADMLKYLKAFGLKNDGRRIRFWTLGEDNWERRFQKAEFERWDHGLLLTIDVPSSAVDEGKGQSRH